MLVLAIFWSIVFGHASAAAPAPATQDNTRHIEALKIDQAPLLDGQLGEPIWELADWQGDFIQLKPAQGNPAQASTRFAVAYNETHIYVALRCLNPTGPSANSRITRRDGNMDLDNAVTVYLDTFHTRRDCYYFSTNSLGTQVEGRIGEDGRTNDKSWDCQWKVTSREDEEGWSAEMAIPVKEMRIPNQPDRTWGINFRRNYPELFETSFWVERDQAWRVSQSGDLRGLHRFKKGFSAALYPYLVGLRTNTSGSERRTLYSSCNGEPNKVCSELITGADLLFDIGSSVNGNLTFNPDFATVEADEAVVNLTRYETFFPEKRLYFLEGAELFRTPINVFYSRRIGFIDWGVKANGRAGKTNFSTLSVHERSTSDEPSSQNSVFRFQRDMFASSNLGVMYVDKTYEGGSNRVLSADGTFSFLNDGKATAQFVGSLPSDGSFTKAIYARAGRSNETYGYSLGFKSIDPGFMDNVNEVGFIQDDDRLELDGSANYRWWLSNGAVEHVDFFSNNDVFWNQDGELRNFLLTGFSGVTFTNKWFAGFSANYHLEVFEKRFYNHSLLPEIGYNLQQWNSYQLLYEHGRNFDKDLNRWVFRSRFKPQEKLALEYRFQYVSLSPDPTHQSTTQHVLEADYNFTSDLFVRLFTQFRSANDRFYVYGLFGWRFVPPFGALYVAYTADQFDVFDALLRPAAHENQRTFFIKLTVPIELIH